MKILVTGSEGLIGSELCPRLEAKGHTVVRFDKKLYFDERRNTRLDVCVAEPIHHYVSWEEVDGIVHLAACSRVILGEKDPNGCIETNIAGTTNVLRAAQNSFKKPWVLFASSREVYGNPPFFPVVEGCPVLPISVYGRTKAVGEDLVLGARRSGLTTGVIRLSNVYGSTSDHPDRAVPAFARVAAYGGTIGLAGPRKTFDFVHVSDAARGLALACERLSYDEAPPPIIQLTTNVGTELGSIVREAAKLAGQKMLKVEINRLPNHPSEVVEFVGENRRAETELGWKPEVAFMDGFRRLVLDYESERKA